MRLFISFHFKKDKSPASRRGFLAIFFVILFLPGLSAQTDSHSEPGWSFGAVEFNKWFGTAINVSANLPHQTHAAMSFAELDFWGSRGFLHSLKTQLYPFDGIALKDNSSSYTMQYTLFLPLFPRITFMEEQTQKKVLSLHLFPLGSSVNVYFPVKNAPFSFDAFSYDAALLIDSDFSPLYLLLRTGWRSRWYGSISAGYKFREWKN